MKSHTSKGKKSKELTRQQKYYLEHRDKILAQRKIYRQEHKEEITKWQATYDHLHPKQPEKIRKARVKNHLKYRDKDLIKFKERYQTNKEYFKEKNRLYNLEHGDKWKARRAEISLDYALAKYPKSMVEKTLSEVGIEVAVGTDLTTFQMFGLLESLGIEPEDCFGFDSFKRRYDRYYGEYLDLKNSKTKKPIIRTRKKNTPK